MCRRTRVRPLPARRPRPATSPSYHELKLISSQQELVQHMWLPVGKARRTEKEAQACGQRIRSKRKQARRSALRGLTPPEQRNARELGTHTYLPLMLGLLLYEERCKSSTTAPEAPSVSGRRRRAKGVQPHKPVPRTSFAARGRVRTSWTSSTPSPPLYHHVLFVRWQQQAWDFRRPNRGRRSCCPHQVLRLCDLRRFVICAPELPPRRRADFKPYNRRNGGMRARFSRECSPIRRRRRPSLTSLDHKAL